jgi:hypothetical protein
MDAAVSPCMPASCAVEGAAAFPECAFKEDRRSGVVIFLFFAGGKEMGHCLNSPPYGTLWPASPILFSLFRTTLFESLV